MSFLKRWAWSALKHIVLMWVQDRALKLPNDVVKAWAGELGVSETVIRGVNRRVTDRVIEAIETFAP